MLGPGRELVCMAPAAQTAFSSMPASASAGRMVSRYLKALEGASALAAYPNAELVAAVELFSGIAMVRLSCREFCM